MREETQNRGWKSRFLVLGTIIGAIAGLLSAWMLVKSAERNNNGEPPEISSQDLLRSTVGIIGIVRGIASLGD